MPCTYVCISYIFCTNSSHYVSIQIHTLFITIHSRISYNLTFISRRVQLQSSIINKSLGPYHNTISIRLQATNCSIFLSIQCAQKNTSVEQTEGKWNQKLSEIHQSITETNTRVSTQIYRSLSLYMLLYPTFIARRLHSRGKIARCERDKNTKLVTS